MVRSRRLTWRRWLTWRWSLMWSRRLRWRWRLTWSGWLTWSRRLPRRTIVGRMMVRRSVQDRGEASSRSTIG
jgi:hypothetical protein